MDDSIEDPARDTARYYVSTNEKSGAMFGKINIKDKTAKELKKMGWKDGSQLEVQIIEREGNRGLWIDLF